jgi:shikimate kinase
MKRIKRRHDRPLLKTDDPGATLRKLMEERDPIYALADLTVQSREVMHEKIVDEIVSALVGRMGTACAVPGGPEGGHEP